MTGIPLELQNFEHTLIHGLRLRQVRRQRRGMLAAGLAVAALLTGTAVAATRALDQPTIAEQNHTQNLDAARSLLSGFLKNDPAQAVDADLSAIRLLTSLPARTGTYSGLNAYIAPTRSGGACIVLLNEASCGGALTTKHPVQALGLGQTPATPFLLIGVEGSFVSKHVIRCGATAEDVTGNAGGTTFAYVATSPSIDPSTCSQQFTLQDGQVVTTPI